MESGPRHLHLESRLLFVCPETPGMLLVTRMAGPLYSPGSVQQLGVISLDIILILPNQSPVLMQHLCLANPWRRHSQPPVYSSVLESPGWRDRPMMTKEPSEVFWSPTQDFLFPCLSRRSPCPWLRIIMGKSREEQNTWMSHKQPLIEPLVNINFRTGMGESTASMRSCPQWRHLSCLRLHLS